MLEKVQKTIRIGHRDDARRTMQKHKREPGYRYKEVAISYHQGPALNLEDHEALGWEVVMGSDDEGIGETDKTQKVGKRPLTRVNRAQTEFYLMRIPDEQDKANKDKRAKDRAARNNEKHQVVYNEAAKEYQIQSIETIFADSKSSK